MKIAGIDFPKSLLDALNDEQLVVFAGAGVSIPEPAGLPSFSKLAKQVASGSNETREQETEDRFLDSRQKHQPTGRRRCCQYYRPTVVATTRTAREQYSLKKIPYNHLTQGKTGPETTGAEQEPGLPTDGAQTPED